MTSSHPTLIVPDTSAESSELLMQLVQDHVQVVYPQGFESVTADGVLVPTEDQHRSQDVQLAALGFLDIIPDGLLLIDENSRICWHNKPFQKLAGASFPVTDLPLWDVLEQEEQEDDPQAGMLAPDPDRVFKKIVHLKNRRHLALRASLFEVPTEGNQSRSFTTLAIRDVTDEIEEKQKRDVLYRVGIELGDLSPVDLPEMNPAERSQILEEKIISACQEVLGFDVIEIRTLHAPTNELRPLLQTNLRPEAALRTLFAEEEGNGVTGLVAATRVPKLCKDTSAEPQYLCGADGARSSMTVPLIMHEEVLGTFNVESSPGHPGFDEKDLEFFDMFAGLVAVAMNQLNLLKFEKHTTAQNSSQQLRKAVAMPADLIVRHASFLLDRYIGHDPDMVEKLKDIIDQTRDIKGSLCNVDDSDSSAADLLSMPESKSRESYPNLKGKRILVVDEDPTVIQSAHDLLEAHGCIVESACDGAQSFLMANQHHYDVAMVHIKLPDMGGYEAFCGLQDRRRTMPIILMTGFGYDAGHAIVKSRQRGLKTVLYKPFRQHQLLAEVEKACTQPPPHE